MLAINRSLVVICLIAGFLPFVMSAQPSKAANARDAKGKKHGPWTYLYDSKGHKTTSIDAAQIYRTIVYEHGLPIGKVKDHYMSGKLQWEGTLLTDEPRDIIDGKCTFFYPEGPKSSEMHFKAGILDGLYRHYHLNGLDSIRGQYQDNDASGIWYYFDRTGQLVLKKNFSTGKGLEWRDLGRKMISARKKADYSTAIAWGEAALGAAKREFGEAHGNYLLILSHLSNLYTIVANYLKAEEAYQKLLDIISQNFGSGDERYFQTLTSFGVFYQRRGMYRKADLMLTESVSIGERLFPIHHAYAVALDNLGSLKLELGKYKEAEHYLIKGKDLKAEVWGIDHPEYAFSLSNLANLYREQGFIEKARLLLIESRDILDAAGIENDQYATIVNNLGEMYVALGLYEEGKNLVMESLEIVKAMFGEGHPEYASSLGNQAALYQTLGDYQKAEEMYEQCLNIINNYGGKEHPDYIWYLGNLGNLLSDLGQFEQAEAVLVETIEISKKTLGKGHETTALRINNLAGNYYEQKQYDKAEEQILQGLKIQKLLGLDSTENYIAGLLTLEQVYSKTGRFEKGDSLLRVAYQIARSKLGENHLMSANVLNNLALNYVEVQEYDLADSLLDVCSNIFERVLGKSNALYVANHDNREVILEQSGKLEEATNLALETGELYLQLLKRYYPGLSATEKLKLLHNTLGNQIQTLYSFVRRNKSFAYKLNPMLMDFDLQVKGLALETDQNAIRSLLERKDSIGLALFESWQTKRVEFTRALKMSKEERAEKGVDLRKWGNQIDSLEKRMSRRSRLFADQFQSRQYRWKDIREKLGRREASISFVDFKYFDQLRWTDTTFYMALVIRSDSQFPQYVKLCKRRDLIDFLNYKQAAEQNTYIQDMGKSYELYQLIWKPLLPYLDNIKEVHLSPSGLINRISLSLLLDNNGIALGQQYQINQYAILKDFIGKGDADPEKQAKSIAIFGGADFNDHNEMESPNRVNQAMTSRRGQVRGENHWDELPGTLQESELIDSILQKKGWSVHSNTKKLASEAKFKQLSGQSPQILHVATHGFFLSKKESVSVPTSTLASFVPFEQNTLLSEHPLMQSGLILKGGNHAWLGGRVLEGQEDGILTAYEIAGLDLRQTELAVLSACETGLGQIDSYEGVLGLQRAFKQAGVDKIIMSLWKVPDKATAEFMKTFYQYYAKGLSIRRAFLKTQKKISKKANPYFWAGFVLVE